MASGDLLFWLVAFVAVVILGISKGGVVGLGLLGVPLLSLVMPPVQAAAVLLPLLLLQDGVSLLSYRRDINRELLLLPLAGAAIGTATAYVFAARVNDGYVRLFVGAIALIFSLNWWLGFAQRRLHHAKPGHHAKPHHAKPGRGAGIFWGAIAGFTSFVAHAGGPPYQIYALPHRIPSRELIATSAWFFALLNMMKVLPYFLLGQFSAANLALSASLAPLAVASTLAGVWLVRRIRTEPFYRLIYAILLCVGLSLAWQGGRALLGL